VRLSKLHIFLWHSIQKRGDTSNRRDYTPSLDTTCEKGVTPLDRRDYTPSPNTADRKWVTPLTKETTHLSLTKKTIITHVSINSEQEKKERYVFPSQFILLNSDNWILIWALDAFRRYFPCRSRYWRSEIRKEAATVDTLKSCSQPQGFARTFIVLSLKAQ